MGCHMGCQHALCTALDGRCQPGVMPALERGRGGTSAQCCMVWLDILDCWRCLMCSCACASDRVDKVLLGRPQPEDAAPALPNGSHSQQLQSPPSSRKAKRRRSSESSEPAGARQQAAARAEDDYMGDAYVQEEQPDAKKKKRQRERTAKHKRRSDGGLSSHEKAEGGHAHSSKHRHRRSRQSE